jgi:hypothetical protein
MRDYKCNEIAAFQNAQKGLFGIEVEVEGDNLPKELPRYWRCIKDGSLRGESMEYVLSKPLDKPEAENAIIYLNAALQDSQLHMSFRTSVHVHLNIQNIYKSQLNRLLYTSFLVEDLLVEFSGEGRVGNRFCLRVRDAEYQLNFLQLMLKINNQLQRIPPDEGKYAAINLCTIRTYGSVEYRSMQGTTDVQTLSRWMSLIEKIYTFACSSSLSLKEITALAVTSPEEFMRLVFGELAEHLMFKNYEHALVDADKRMFYLAFEEEKLVREGDKVEKKKPAQWRADPYRVMNFDDIFPAEPREIEFNEDEAEEEGEAVRW